MTVEYLHEAQRARLLRPDVGIDIGPLRFEWPGRPVPPAPKQPDQLAVKRKAKASYPEIRDFFNR